MTLTVRGLVIRVVEYRESDKLVSILTEEHGKLFFKANAVRSLTNPNSAACNLFSYSEFVLQKKGERFYLSKAQVLNLPLGNACDLGVLTAASYFGELCDDVGRDVEGAANALRLLMNALYLLQKKDRPTALIKAVFELRLLSQIGFLPQLTSCGSCGTTATADLTHFHPVEGVMLCSNCARVTDARVVSAALHRLLVRTVTVPENQAYALKLDEDLLYEFSCLTEDFVLSQLQRDFKTLTFYHQMKGLV